MVAVALWVVAATVEVVKLTVAMPEPLVNFEGITDPNGVEPADTTLADVVGRYLAREGFEVTGTHNHPVLCLEQIGGVPMLQWKLLDEVESGPDEVTSSAEDRPGSVREP